jgi:deferrochelatase/peroxidase EfeB
MTQALVTVICPLAPDRVPDAEQAIDQLGNPAAAEIQAALDRLDGEEGTHFVSLHAVLSGDRARAYLVLELSADGSDQAAITRLTTAIGDRLHPIFLMSSDWTSGRELPDYLLRHRVAVGGGWFSNPGAVFSGTPDLSVGRIRTEAALAARVAQLLGDQDADPQASDWIAMQRIEALRLEIAKDPDLKPCLQAATPAPRFVAPSIIELVFQLIGAFAVTFLWPVGLLLLAWGIVSIVLASGQSHGVISFVWNAGGWFLSGLLVVVVVLLITAGLAYKSFRKAEDTDWLEERSTDRETLAAMFQRENHLAQNHMISITQRKPGILRKFSSRLIFWAVAQLVQRQYRPGFLSDIGTIHFARWVTPPGSPDVMFFSNYDASWESYLEDFITRAHAGLTGVWSNSIGFPRAVNLIQRGATDGERFKRYARHSMQPTRFWYSGYPKLTTTEIRTNSEIRRGLSSAMTQDEATRFLALFGSATRPDFKLVSNEIQSLLFGGLSFLPFGTCLLFSLPAETARARAWLNDVSPHIAFNDGRRLGAPAVVTLALGAPGLARLGLPEEALRTFPFAFQEGMISEARARILGDLGENAPEYWWWGQHQPDAALLVYGRSADAVASLQTVLLGIASQHGAELVNTIPLKEITKDKREAFGFVDGISQPVIRGTYKGIKEGESIHLVEPGEFILGYPDNRGGRPPGPILPATADTANLLPLIVTPEGFDRTMVETVRDLGCNGSFLVIRQLEQDREAFDAYCLEEAERLKYRLPPPYDATPEFIAAKMVGRWQDGSSLVRHPYESHTREKAKEQARRHPDHATGPATGAATGHPTGHPTGHAPQPAEAANSPCSHNDNSFLFGTEDPEGLRCPFAAHVRRANPRDSFDPGSREQIDISNRHRIIRVGRQYAPAPGQKPGLLFMCLNGDIERQFEFVQQSWLLSPGFSGLSCEKDPLLGDGAQGECGFTIPNRDGPVRLAQVPRFIATRGGGYFFLPGKRLIDFLSTQ